MKKILPVFIFCAIFFSSSAQQNNALTTKDYENAEKLMGYNTQQFVDRGSVSPNWLPGDKFWYRVLTPKGSEFMLVDPSKGIRTTAFDQEKLAAALSTARIILKITFPLLAIGTKAD